jgi:hypothetical protein
MTVDDEIMDLQLWLAEAIVGDQVTQERQP